METEGKFGLAEYALVEDRLDRVGRRATQHEFNRERASNMQGWELGYWLFCYVLNEVYQYIEQFDDYYRVDLEKKFNHHRQVRQEASMHVDMKQGQKYLVDSTLD